MFRTPEQYVYDMDCWRLLKVPGKEVMKTFWISLYQMPIFRSLEIDFVIAPTIKGIWNLVMPR